jgi:hypothetical protein
MTMNGMDAGGAQGQTPGGNMGEGDPGMPCSSLLMLRRGPLHRCMFSWSTLQAAEGAKKQKTNPQRSSQKPLYSDL